MKRRFCFITEVDLDAKADGAVTTDQQMLRRITEFGDVDVIYLKRTKYGSLPLALGVFFADVAKSFSKPYNIYFSRGLINSLFLVSFNALTLKKRKIVHRALSVPLVSREVKFLKAFGIMESFLRYSLFLILEHFVYSHVDIVTVAAEVYAQELIQTGVMRNKTYVLNFVTGKEFFAQPFKEEIDATFKFCYIGSFQLYQDLLPVLEAFDMISKTARDVELLLVGDGPQRSKMEEEAANRKLRGVKFLGKIQHASLPALLSRIDCFISLTRKPGLSISIVEAAASGKAIIALDQKNDGTYSNYFTHEKEIYLVNTISPDEIAKAMQLLYEDSDLRNRLAHGARRVAEQHLSEKVQLKQLEELIQKTTKP